MFGEVLFEVRKKLTPMFGLLWLLTLIAIISFAIYKSQHYILRDTLEYFSFVLNSALPIIFPIITVLVYVATFSGEVHHRFLVYTRMRRPILTTLYIKLLANIILTFLFFFSLIYICFLFAYYIEPHIGIAKYEPAGFGLTKDNIEADTYTRYTFTQLLQYGTITYSILYSFWVAMNAALYAGISFFLVLFIKNRFLALSLPFIIYVITIFTLISLDLEIYRLNYVIFPFDRVQDPLWKPFIPFIILLLILLCFLLYVKRNPSKVDSFS
ncbi:hypothetical protein J2Z69_001843 [Paenibacillus shirakamiensis]|uniref:ABC transporter permease n=1 Tax=Paenibacillus shirakamiensis TaxID=1265935 RepID=A0ABS4JGH3_9BACL|nr:hypothetical protein [Paenibacillus shirakamiensis]MBP2000812.1 hypothetical protein [Paenibacillus shirakamiensis]